MTPVYEAKDGDTLRCEVCLRNGEEQPAKTILDGSSVCLTHWCVRQITKRGKNVC